MPSQPHSHRHSATEIRASQQVGPQDTWLRLWQAALSLARMHASQLLQTTGALTGLAQICPLTVLVALHSFHLNTIKRAHSLQRRDFRRRVPRARHASEPSLTSRIACDRLPQFFPIVAAAAAALRFSLPLKTLFWARLRRQVSARTPRRQLSLSAEPPAILSHISATTTSHRDGRFRSYAA